MGTGICVQILTSNFPYPAGWLRTIGYIFWILDICLFGFFTAMSLARALIFPKVAFAVLSDIQQTCYLGAIPTAWETIGTGLVIFYPNNQSAVIVAEVFFWIAVAMTLLVSCGGMYALYKWQGQHKLSEVTGAWLLIFIPMIVAATYGSNLASTVSLKPGSAILVVSFLMLSLGVGLSFLVLGIYLWRLMACQLPPRDAIVSTLVPVGPPGMAAYATVNLAVALSRYIEHDEFSFRQGWESALTPAARTAVSESIIWIGVIGGLFFLGVASFFLVEAIASVLTKIPKAFNIGFWSFVFPVGVYANGFCRLSQVLRNEVMKGWAATCVACTVCLWLMCALLTTYKAVWQGKLFFAPGLQGWVEQKQLDELSKEKGLSPGETLDAIQSSREPHGNGASTRRQPQNDGTYDPSAVDSHASLGSA